MSQNHRWQWTMSNTGHAYVMDAEGFLILSSGISIETAKRVVRLHNQVADQLAELVAKQENVR